tara:strand:- start:135 stop:818 length:684 start_codon:yes stop_codon:yes gene_type:complete
MSTNNKLIKIDLNQTVSRFELAEIQKDKKRWYIVFGTSFFFVLILIFNYFILNNYTDLLSSRLNDIDELNKDTARKDAIIKRLFNSKQDSLGADIIIKNDITKLYNIEKNQRLTLSDKLEELASNLPDDISLIKLDYDYNKNSPIVELTVAVKYDGVDNNVTLSHLMNDLEEKLKLGVLKNFGKGHLLGLKKQDISKHKGQPYNELILIMKNKEPNKSNEKTDKDNS